MNLLSQLRLFKIGPFAVFDTAISFIGIYLLAPLLSKIFRFMRLDIPLISWLWFVMPLSVVFHLVFAQQTPLMQLLSSSNGYVAIGVLFGMTFMGIRKIHIMKF